ncbi:MAG: formylglycine-generating enzyme family protein [Bacteroidetes bacterium]|nr:formylglycine-generating enzyme family protein [Bacteroidota bacterium]MBU1679845.1 formylglycine-generating enzyme family protein [Bacteroidota bacterium]MBU2506928.1 formylglycine-generating enzyme family protein [Bacteroidota bacterium]
MSKNSIAILLFIILTGISCKDNPTAPEQNNIMIPELILINKDLTFTMGNSWGKEVEANEIPAHTVKLSPYYIGKYEVTNEEYLCFVKDNGYTDSSYWSPDGWKLIKELNITCPIHWDSTDTPWINYGYSNQARMPICNITWWEAEAYCIWLSKKTGENYSLPTEAQWERAARGPDPGRRFPWGNISDTAKYNDVGFFSYGRYMRVVGSYPDGKSYDGCFDFSGNAIEYCKDWYDFWRDSSYYKWCSEQGTVVDPKGPISGKSKVIRGVQNMLSAIYEESREITTTRRFLAVLYTLDGQLHKGIDNNTGFRVVKTVL